MDVKGKSGRYKKLLKEEIHKTIKDIQFNYGVFVCIIAYYLLLLPTLLWAFGCAVQAVLILAGDVNTVVNFFIDSNGYLSVFPVDVSTKALRLLFPLRIYIGTLVFFTEFFGVIRLFLLWRNRRHVFTWKNLSNALLWASIIGFGADLILRSFYNLAAGVGAKATVCAASTTVLWLGYNLFMFTNSAWLRSVWRRYEDPSALWPLYWSYNRVQRDVHYMVRF